MGLPLGVGLAFCFQTGPFSLDKKGPGLRRALASLTEYLRNHFIWFAFALVSMEEELLDALGCFRILPVPSIPHPRHIDVVVFAEGEHYLPQPLKELSR